jgi:hypothetical protein
VNYRATVITLSAVITTSNLLGLAGSGSGWRANRLATVTKWSLYLHFLLIMVFINRKCLP